MKESSPTVRSLEWESTLGQMEGEQLDCNVMLDIL